MSQRILEWNLVAAPTEIRSVESCGGPRGFLHVGRFREEQRGGGGQRGTISATTTIWGGFEILRPIKLNQHSLVSQVSTQVFGAGVTSAFLGALTSKPLNSADRSAATTSKLIRAQSLARHSGWWVRPRRQSSVEEPYSLNRRQHPSPMRWWRRRCDKGPIFSSLWTIKLLSLIINCFYLNGAAKHSAVLAEYSVNKYLLLP